MSEEGLVKVHIDLPCHWAIGGESLWATPLGENLYKIENIPFYAYGINFHDIVKAISPSENHKPEIKEIVEESGHKTFRVFFQEITDRKQQEDILNTLKDLTITYERANGFNFSLDMLPNGNYQNVIDKLDQLEKDKILEFETCEARVEGSFDDSPN